MPYWHAGNEAAFVLDKVSALAAIVENETNLTAYDPQVERLLRETPSQGPVELMSRVTEDLRSRFGG